MYSRGLIDHLIEFEGYSPRPYTCPAGKLTIGIGHVLTDRERQTGYIGDIRWTSGLTKGQAVDVLIQDLNRINAGLTNVIPSIGKLSPTRHEVLLSWAFNVGLANAARSTLARLVAQGDLAGVPAQLRRWVYGGGQKLPGLVRRREREAQVWIADSWEVGK